MSLIRIAARLLTCAVLGRGVASLLDRVGEALTLLPSNGVVSHGVTDAGALLGLSAGLLWVIGSREPRP